MHARLATDDFGVQRKPYAWHAPEVDCISKGKARQPYDIGGRSQQRPDALSDGQNRRN